MKRFLLILGSLVVVAVAGAVLWQVRGDRVPLRGRAVTVLEGSLRV